MDTKTARIRALNDQLRRHLADGIAAMTPGVAALGVEAVQRIVKTIALFDDFCHTNDPYEEHDFGTFDMDGHAIMFKIDYFRSEHVNTLARSRRSLRHPTSYHDHARGRVLTTATRQVQRRGSGLRREPLARLNFLHRWRAIR